MSAPTLLLHGPLAALSGFSLVNRRLVDGLGGLGWRVEAIASDRSATHAPAVGLPDVYVFHGHPYDVTNAPGRVNAFYLSYDYARFVAADRHLATRLNAWFDVLLVPSRFSGAACRRSGVTIPIHVCGYGVDASEFHPAVRPVAVPHKRRFCFIALGGATERKGTDILIDAFAREFSEADDVTLLVKAFGYAHLEGWADAQVRRATQRRAPHMVVDRSQAASVAPYLAAADVGVFPFRGEGFGLPILECLATGRPAIVTAAGGPLDYARVGVRWLKAPHVRRHGKWQVAPDVRDLRRFMREAVRRGPASDAERRRIARAAAAHSWTRAVDRVDHVLRHALARADGRRRASPTAPTAYFFLRDGVTSWRQLSGHVDRALSRRDRAHRSAPFTVAAPVPRARIVVAQSGFALEAFRRSDERTSRRVLHRESGPMAAVAAIVRREREACGVPAPVVAPMALWRDRAELDLADVIVVTSQFSRGLYVDAGYAPARIRILSPGISRHPPARRRSGVTRLLFVASNPFRKGVRVLLDAWSRIDGRAELWCVSTSEMLASPLVLQHLTRDDRITVLPYGSKRRLAALFDEVDVIVLPSFEEGFPATVGEGMARAIPAIVSASSGITDILEAGVNGLVVESGDAASLACAIDAVCSSRPLIRRLGAAARETARKNSWARYQRRWRELIDLEAGR